GWNGLAVQGGALWMIRFDNERAGSIEAPARCGDSIAWRGATKKIENGLHIPRRLIHAAGRGAQAHAIRPLERPGVERRCRDATGCRNIGVSRLGFKIKAAARPIIENQVKLLEEDAGAI